MSEAQLFQGIIFYFILLGSLSVHEWAHAWSAVRLGDPTPRLQGRVTFNPLAHIDPIGTVAIPLVMILAPMFFGSTGFAIFGWGKPVIVNPRNFRSEARDDILVSMAGPFSNLVICLVFSVLFGLLLNFMDVGSFAGLLWDILRVNAILLVFNLIPIPPLDGSHVLRRVIGMREETYLALCQYGFIILLVVINLPIFRLILGSGVEYVLGLCQQVINLLG